MDEFVLCNNCIYAIPVHSRVECRRKSMILGVGHPSYGYWPEISREDQNSNSGCFQGKCKPDMELLND